MTTDAPVWARLARRAADAAAPFHLTTVATIGPDGGPTARMAVLRGVDPDRRRLVFHTDARSPKAAALRADPRIGLIFWHPGEGLQLRCAAHAHLAKDGAAADAAWADLAPHQQALYSAPQPPGDPLRDGLEPGPGRAAFLLVDCAVSEIDALKLARERHERIRYRYDAAGALIAAEPLAP